MLEINNIKNGNVYVDGTNFLGKVDEAITPDIVAKFIEKKPLGMIGIKELFAGIDKMESTLKWNCFYLDAIQKCSKFTQAVDIQVRSSLETWTGNGLEKEVPVIYYFRGTPKNIPGLGTIKSQENSESETKFAVSYCKITHDGNEIVEVDIDVPILKVNGEDLLKKYKKNLGITL